MPNEIICNVFSLYKAYQGERDGTLLRAFQNMNLCFDGTSSGPLTNFVRTNKGKKTTFHIAQSGLKYSIAEVNTSITLKQFGHGTVFKVKRVSYPAVVTIKSAQSGLYLTCDHCGKVNMRQLDGEYDMEAWFKIESVEDTTDGVSYLESTCTSDQTFKANNQTEECDLQSIFSTHKFDTNNNNTKNDKKNSLGKFGELSLESLSFVDEVDVQNNNMPQSTFSLLQKDGRKRAGCTRSLSVA